ncbi:4'-phosphopantetheinyl transferase superfamily protein [Nocardioides sp.]|uniref:4'-phosphopantetheinyl transferase family protein n=1 Tax=Nocardioides sp. TaxID=35761 RepID=UPI002621B499|nr:4'-phosphopantetheinyl transferase superfamily protein [Nocardioides sp.]
MKPPVIRFDEVPPSWVAQTQEAGPSHLPTWAAGLEAWERERFARHRTAEARAAYVFAHELARACLAELAGEPVAFAQRCAGCGGTDHGAPYVPGREDLHVSLSHSHRFVAAMAASRPCGIDVQQIGRVPDRALTGRERSHAGDDRARSRLWARKEALIKAGVATLDDLGTLDVLDPDPRVHDRTFEDTAWAGQVVGAWVLLA